MQDVRAAAEEVARVAGHDVGDAWLFVLRVCDLAALGKGPAAIAQHYARDFEIMDEDVRQVDAALDEHAGVVDALRIAYSVGFARALEESGNTQRAWDRVNAVREAVFSELA